jgi:hypothetical protein
LQLLNKKMASAWATYCTQAEVPAEIQSDLMSAVGGSTVVLLLDDSGSMSTPVRPPGSSPFAPVTTTRWTELQNDVVGIIQLVTSINPRGVDCYFMNRQGATGVNDVSQVAPLFAAPPEGATPIVGSLQRLFSQYARTAGRVIFVVVTDGEPSDGDFSALFRTIQSMPSNFFLSLVEANDNEEEMVGVFWRVCQCSTNENLLVSPYGALLDTCAELLDRLGYSATALSQVGSVCVSIYMYIYVCV